MSLENQRVRSEKGFGWEVGSEIRKLEVGKRSRKVTKEKIRSVSGKDGDLGFFGRTKFFKSRQTQDSVGDRRQEDMYQKEGNLESFSFEWRSQMKGGRNSKFGMTNECRNWWMYLISTYDLRVNYKQLYHKFHFLTLHFYQTLTQQLRK